jgi:hypothetical protein
MVAGDCHSYRVTSAGIDYGAPGAYATCGAMITADVLVKVQGAIKNGVTESDNHIAQLPIGLRPAAMNTFLLIKLAALQAGLQLLPMDTYQR